MKPPSCREDGDHPHHTPVVLVEQATQEYANHHVEQLLDAVAQAAPEQPTGCLLFQTLHAIGEYALSLRLFSR